MGRSCALSREHASIVVRSVLKRITINVMQNSYPMLPFLGFFSKSFSLALLHDGSDFDDSRTSLARYGKFSLPLHLLYTS